MNGILNIVRSLSNLQPPSELKYNQFFGLNFATIADNTKVIIDVREVEFSVIYKLDDILFYKSVHNAKPPTTELQKRLPKGTYHDLSTLKCSLHDDVNTELHHSVVDQINQIAEVIVKALPRNDHCVYCLALAGTHNCTLNGTLESYGPRDLTFDDYLNEVTYHNPNVSHKQLRDAMAAFRRAQTNPKVVNVDKITLQTQRLHLRHWTEILALVIHKMECLRNSLSENENFRVRDVQIIAIMLALINGKKTFLEVKTGEGKTIVIAIIAAVKLLLHDSEYVDIITCNDALAKDNHLEMIPFFSSLAISSGCNNPSDSVGVYKQQVVYGALHNFQYDHLHTSTAGNAGRGERKFALCIIDEVDLLTIDNSKHMAKIAAPFPGIEELRTVYGQIFHTPDAGLNLEKVPKYLRDLCEHMHEEWKNVCRHIKENRYMKDHYYTLVDDRIAPIDVHSGVVLSRSVFNNGMHQFLEMYHAQPVSPEIFNSICISNYGYLSKYKQLCGFTGTLGTGEMEKSLLSKMFGKLSFYRIPRYCESQFQHQPTLIVKDGEFDIFRKALEIGDNVTIFAETRYTRMNKLQELTKSVPQIQLMELDEYYATPQESLNTEVLIADNFFKSSSELEVHFEDINQYPNLLGDFHRYSCIRYRDAKINWKLNIIDHLLSADHREVSKPHLKCFKSQLNAFKKKHKKITVFYDTDWDFGVDGISVDNMIKKRVSQPAANEVFVFPFLRGPFKPNCKLKYMKELNMFQDIVMLQTSQQRYMFVFGKHAKHFQVITAEMKNMLASRRAVLVVFENLKLLNRFNMLLPKKYKDKVKVYDGKDDLGTIECGAVILTTNIGGRGTDYHITEELSNNGGLHVIITFMPPNERVQWQAFGRTARNGNPGSGQIIVDAHHLTYEQNYKDVLLRRDDHYKQELHQMRDKVMRDLQMHHDLTTAFGNMRRQLREEHSDSTEEYDFVLDDLTEFWAVWLKKNLKNNPDFQAFEKAAEYLIKMEGFYNPCHWVRRATYYLRWNFISKAKEVLLATFDQEVYGEAIIREYVNFARIAILKGVLLAEAEEALHKEPHLLYHVTHELVQQIRETSPTDNELNAKDPISIHKIQERILSSIYLPPLISIKQKICLLFPAIACAVKNQDIAKVPKYFKAFCSTQSAEDEAMSQTLAEAAQYISKHAIINLLEYLNLKIPMLFDLVEIMDQIYKTNFPNIIQSHMEFKEKLQKIILDEITTSTHVTPQKLETILKNELEFCIQRSPDEFLEAFQKACHRINRSIDETNHSDYQAKIEPRIVMEAFGDGIQHYINCCLVEATYENKVEFQSKYCRQQSV